MTERTRWLALLCLMGLGAGFAFRNPILAYLTLTLLLWMIASYLQFAWACYRALRSIEVVRRVQGREQDRHFIWAGRTYDIELQITSKSPFQTGWRFRDIVPDILEVRRSSQSEFANRIDSTVQASRCPIWLRKLSHRLEPKILDRDDPNHPFCVNLQNPARTVSIRYKVHPLGAGFGVLPGVRFHFTDPKGWFRWDTTIAKKQTLRILPGYRGKGELRQFSKGNNVIPQYGMHRQRRPGMGFELLELREYADGDPPKTIAWKASARRDTLMTRQYESEVPIRVQLFIEGTVSCRIGSYGRRVIDQMNMIAASLGKLTTRGGDWIGAYLVDNRGTTRVPAATGESGFYRLAQALSEFSSSEMPNRFQWTQGMQDATYGLISEYYPERLITSYNPTGLKWFDAIRFRANRQRFQLSCVLADHYQLTDLEHVQLYRDNEFLAEFMQKFLWEHGNAWTSPMIPYSEAVKFLVQNAIDSLVKSIQQALMRAKDNEVFVVITDLLSSSRDIGDLLHMIRTARSRHHRVVVISQSPDFERLKESEFATQADGQLLPQSASDWRQFAWQIQVQERLSVVRRQFQELAVPFAVTDEESSIPIVLAEIDLARSGRLAAHTGGRIRS